MHNRQLASKWPLGLKIARAAILAVFLASCRTQAPVSLNAVSIGTTASEVNALILIAKEQGYFTGNGINLIHRTYPSGAAALAAVLAHEVDLATGSEFAFVGQILAAKEICTLASIDRSSLEHLVARRDGGISDLVDLKGKTVGVPIASRPEFALDRFLFFRGIDVSELTLVDVPVDQSVEALAGGKVDAVASWQPYVDRAKERLGGQIVTWSIQEDQPSYTLVMSKAGWAVENRELATRFLRSLVQAEEYVAGKPEAARALLYERLGYDQAYINSVWAEHAFSILLDQALVVAMEDQARWIINKNSAGNEQMPDLVVHICSEALEGVKPEAVNLIR
jgi:ABC-type nitrate/sulfonate/bicarbonate transport system substrate-binding protein